MEFETVKEALQYLHDVSQADEIRVDGQTATAKGYQELIFEVTACIADLLGMSEIYLGGDPNE